MDALVEIGAAVGFIAHYDAVGGYERGLDIDETLMEEVGGFYGAVSLATGPTRHDL